MKALSLGYGFVCAVALAISSPVNADGSKLNTPMIGIQDSQTGVFRPLTVVVPDASTTTTTTGTVEVTFNVKLVSPFAKGSSLRCMANLEGAVTNTSTGTSTFYTESASVGVAVNGTTATCTTNIPYAWLLPSSGTNIDTFAGTYILLIESVTSTGAPTTIGLLTRSSDGGFVSATKIPASGTISKFSVAVTL